MEVLSPQAKPIELQTDEEFVRMFIVTQRNPYFEELYELTIQSENSNTVIPLQLFQSQKVEIFNESPPDS